MPANEITNLKRHLAKWELEHLRLHAAELAERLERAERDRDYYMEILDDSWNDKMRLLQELEEYGAELGLDKNGSLSVTLPNVTASAEKPIDRMPTLIYLTDVQRAALSRILQEQGRQGGSIIAQIWPDGIRAALITDQEHDRIREVISPGKEHKFFKTAADDHADYLRNEVKKSEAA